MKFLTGPCVLVVSNDIDMLTYSSIRVRCPYLEYTTHDILVFRWTLDRAWPYLTLPYLPTLHDESSSSSRKSQQYIYIPSLARESSWTECHPHAIVVRRRLILYWVRREKRGQLTCLRNMKTSDDLNNATFREFKNERYEFNQVCRSEWKTPIVRWLGYTTSALLPECSFPFLWHEDVTDPGISIWFSTQFHCIINNYRVY